MKSIQHPENHPVFMAIPPQPHHETLPISPGSQLFPALKFNR